MKKFLEKKLVRVRCKKNYAEAHCHVIIGEVLDENEAYVVIKGKAFHFNKLDANTQRQHIMVGAVCVRIIPWHNIEVIHWIGPRCDYNADVLFDGDHNLVLDDKKHTVISFARDSE